MTTVTATQAKTTFLELLRGVADRGDAVEITRNGKPSGVLVSAEEWESLLETVSILSDKTAMRKIARARRELETGAVVEHDRVWGKNGVPPAVPSRRRPGRSRPAAGGRRKGASRSRAAGRKPPSR
jgi:prevent-host-death family protein